MHYQKQRMNSNVYILKTQSIKLLLHFAQHLENENLILHPTPFKRAFRLSVCTHPSYIFAGNLLVLTFSFMMDSQGW